MQLLATLFFSFIIDLSYSAKSRLSLYPDSFVTAFILFFVLANIIYLGITCWQNEKFNHNQTWRLIPLHDSQLYLTNTISSGIAFIYLDLLLGIELALILVIFYPFDGYTRQQVAAFGYWVTHLTWLKCGKLLLAALLLLLIGLAVYLTVSFLNFSSHAVIDFWPGKSHQIITWLVRLIMIILVSGLLVISYNIWWDVSANIGHFLTGSSYQDMEMTIPKISISGDFGLFLLYDVIILVIDLWLFTHYVEAKVNR
ncbi:hypothetical protein OZY43_07200 [Lactobacillus sp. ESL0785]|uniref:hypothetical protein n=1 Tax=Lactobacillus sp. ESL0785 TaxID=2983232 RepID=UPI0023F97732|nr:hypothetical protein [Lactobacillus sp. ESL0785]WEV70717.1 hypothetical protein OZY43_07200 [Lactobacillus sp. ESL0785]